MARKIKRGEGEYPLSLLALSMFQVV
jgi:hypothetical protein